MGHIQAESHEAAGVYRVQLATRQRALHEEPRMAFVVAPPADESDLSPGAAPELEHADAAASVAAGTVVERPLAPWLFLLVGLLAIAEAALRLRPPLRARAS